LPLLPQGAHPRLQKIVMPIRGNRALDA